MDNYSKGLTNKLCDDNFRDGFYYENYGRLMVPRRENSTRVPTWQEFVTYLIKTPISRCVKETGNKLLQVLVYKLIIF